MQTKGTFPDGHTGSHPRAWGMRVVETMWYDTQRLAPTRVGMRVVEWVADRAAAVVAGAGWVSSNGCERAVWVTGVGWRGWRGWRVRDAPGSREALAGSLPDGLRLGWLCDAHEMRRASGLVRSCQVLLGDVAYCRTGCPVLGGWWREVMAMGREPWSGSGVVRAWFGRVRGHVRGRASLVEIRQLSQGKGEARTRIRAVSKLSGLRRRTPQQGECTV